MEYTRSSIKDQMATTPQHLAKKQSINLNFPLITETILRSVVQAGYINNLQVLALGEDREYIIIFKYGKSEEIHALGTARNELKRFKSLDTARSSLTDLGIHKFQVGQISDIE